MSGSPYPKTVEKKATDESSSGVDDPFQWLEESVRTSEEVKQWAVSQSDFTKAYLEKIPERVEVTEEVTQLMMLERLNSITRKGQRWFVSHFTPGDNFSVIYTSSEPLSKVIDAPREKMTELINPNTMSERGNLSLSSWSISPCGKFVAYTISENGSDWNKAYFKQITSEGKVVQLEDTLEWLKFSGLSWDWASKGIFYSKYPAADDEDSKLLKVAERQSVYYHRMGDPQEKDVLIFSGDDHPKWCVGGSVTQDGRFLIISRFESAGGYAILLAKDLREPLSAFRPIYPDFKHVVHSIGSIGDSIYVLDDKSPRMRIVAYDMSEPELRERVIVPENPEGHVIEDASVLPDGSIVVTYMKDASTVVEIFNCDGERVSGFETPQFGSVGVSSGLTFGKLYYTFNSFNRPTSLFEYNLWTGKHAVVYQPKLPFDPEEFVVKQAFVTSKDGKTKVPAFVLHKKDFKKDASKLGFLYGYGGFTISNTPFFSAAALEVARKGGVYVSACIRGGGEYGEEWHLGGAQKNKQNSFDDFIAVAEWMIAEKYTSKNKLCISGGSNGGLLVSAVMAQRPELFRCVIPRVPVTDMLRFHKFTAGVYWKEEYGDPDNEEDRKVLSAYSPYHAVLRNGPKDYPTTMVMTADTDDRVVPAHSFKLIAALRQNQKNEKNKIFGRIEIEAGHGAGMSATKIIDSAADIVSFAIDATRN